VATELEFIYKKIDTVVPGVDQHYLTCFDGEVGIVASKFIQDAVIGYPLLVQGLYPISNDYQGKIGKTEERMLRSIKPKYFPILKVSWNDLLIYSSNSNNSVIDQSKIEKISTIDDVVNDYFSRLRCHLECVVANRIPCIYIAGRTSQVAFERACDLDIVTDKIGVSDPYDIFQCSIYGRISLVLIGRAHPSAHLLSGKSASDKEFAETMHLLNAMGRCTLEAMENKMTRITPDHLSVCIRVELEELEMEMKAQIEGRKKLTELFYNDPSGRFPEEHRMLRYMDGHIEEVRELVTEWQTWGTDILWSILLHGSIYLNPLKYKDSVVFWRGQFANDDLFAKFMSSGAARFLTDEQIKESLLTMHQNIGHDEVFVNALSYGLVGKLSNREMASNVVRMTDTLRQIFNDN